mmetsp:Transcript_20582/g.25239  ORF Transcript_20582/g.25239 Transcript_20582/m.25239 type:complete len:192 (-) Transcript_20582:24-599(-)
MWALGVISVNEYVAYIASNTLIWRKKKKDLLPHHEFRKSVVLALMNREQFYALAPRIASPRTPRSSRERTAGRPKKKIRLTKRISNLRSSTNKRTMCRVNEKSLYPVHRELNCRLDTSVPHLPDDNVDEQRSKSLRCALHRWNDRTCQIKRDVVICSTCKISLCIWCFKKFHREPDANKLREYLCTIIKNL